MTNEFATRARLRSYLIQEHLIDASTADVQMDARPFVLTFDHLESLFSHAYKFGGRNAIAAMVPFSDPRLLSVAEFITDQAKGNAS